MNKTLSKAAELYKSKTLQYLPKSARKEFLDSDLEDIAGRFNISIEVELETSSDTYRSCDNEDFYENNWDYALENLKPDYCQAESSVLENYIYVDSRLEKHLEKCFTEILNAEERELILEKITDFHFDFSMYRIDEAGFLQLITKELEESTYEHLQSFCRDLETFSSNNNISIYEFAELSRYVEHLIGELADDYISDFEPDHDDVRSWIDDNCEREDSEIDLCEVAKSDLPRLFKKFGRMIEVCEDGSLSNGYEVIINYKTKYLKGLEQAIDFIDTLYLDLETSNARMDSDSTGLHINISYASDEILEKGMRDWCDTTGKIYNPFKALLFLNEDKAGPIGRNLPDSRYNCRWCEPIKDRILKDLKSSVQEQLSFLTIGPDSSKICIEDSIEKFLKNFSFDYKSTGFNYRYLTQRGYIEFRYPGHKIEKEDVVELLFYFCHITRLVFDKKYLHKEANLKKYKFISELFSLQFLNPEKNFQERKKVYQDFLLFKKQEYFIVPKSEKSSQILTDTEKRRIDEWIYFFVFNSDLTKGEFDFANLYGIKSFVHRINSLRYDFLLFFETYDLWVRVEEDYRKIVRSYYGELIVSEQTSSEFPEYFNNFSKYAEEAKTPNNVKIQNHDFITTQLDNFIKFLFLNKDMKQMILKSTFSVGVGVANNFRDNFDSSTVEGVNNSIGIAQQFDSVMTINHLF